jgi:hypothetical protein
VLPQGLVVTVLADPVLVHVGQGAVAEELGHDALDVAVLAAGVAELRVCAVAVVRPETVNCPRV